MTLLKRILTEKRAVVFPLLFALLVNVAVYALVVYPLNRRAAGAVDRAAKAAEALKAAERDQAAAQALVTGKARAEEELATFYDRVLPADYVSARRMTYTRLPALARKADVRLPVRIVGSRPVDQEQPDRPAALPHGPAGRLPELPAFHLRGRELA